MLHQQQDRHVHQHPAYCYHQCTVLSTLQNRHLVNGLMDFVMDITLKSCLQEGVKCSIVMSYPSCIKYFNIYVSLPSVPGC